MGVVFTRPAKNPKGASYRESISAKEGRFKKIWYIHHTLCQFLQEVSKLPIFLFLANRVVQIKEKGFSTREIVIQEGQASHVIVIFLFRIF